MSQGAVSMTETLRVHSGKNKIKCAWSLVQTAAGLALLIASLYSLSPHSRRASLPLPAGKDPWLCQFLNCASELFVRVLVGLDQNCAITHTDTWVSVPWNCLIYWYSFDLRAPDPMCHPHMLLTLAVPKQAWVAWATYREYMLAHTSQWQAKLSLKQLILSNLRKPLCSLRGPGIVLEAPRLDTC